MLWWMLANVAGAQTVTLDAELGFLAPLAHRVQFGHQGTDLDYVKEGGQDNLFPLFRPTAALRWRRQTFTALWQPLDLRTTVALDHPLRVDSVTFPAERPIDLRYGFSFWRLSWGDRVVDRHDLTVTLGLGLQIRNATIGFVAVDGSQARTNRDIGPVPLLEFELRKRYDDGGFWEAEVDGFYAPIKYLNGRDVDVVGAIADIQLRAGLRLKDLEPASGWVGLRYLGGGSSGTGPADADSDGYTENWLHFLTLTLGLRLEPGRD
ncbi:MAG: hypothetical protein R3F59_19950 [Myxococcota bacterium]